VLSSSVYDAARPHRDILDYCSEIGIECLDLLPVLGEAWERDHQPVYFPIDRHLNPHGYQLSADAIATFLLAEGAPY
jgi:undecaprenyl pyrophosphate synthase